MDLHEGSLVIFTVVEKPFCQTLLLSKKLPHRNLAHKTDELVVLTEEEIELEIEGKAQRPKIREEVFIPADDQYKGCPEKVL